VRGTSYALGARASAILVGPFLGSA
jgi:hypothetical protein